MTALPAEIEAQMREIFASQGFMSTLGAELVVVTKGHVVIEAPIDGRATQQDGFAHAGLGFTLGDTAAGCATATHFEPGDRVLTTEMKTNLLRPASGVLIRAVGRVIKPGRQISTAAADVFTLSRPDDPEPVHVATMLGSMIRIPAS